MMCVAVADRVNIKFGGEKEHFYFKNLYRQPRTEISAPSSQIRLCCKCGTIKQ